MDTEVKHDRCHGKPGWSCPRCMIDDTGGRTPTRFVCTGTHPLPLPRGRLVALAGLAGSGKSVVAGVFADRGFVVVKFAETLKRMMRCLGLTDAHIEGALKEIPCPQLGGKTPRFAMQTIGTEWGRDIINPFLWIGDWRRRAEVHLAAGENVVVDDLRFENEAATIKALSGTIVRVVRPEQVKLTGHQSEGIPLPFDLSINNYGTLSDLKMAADATAQLVMYGLR